MEAFSRRLNLHGMCRGISTPSGTTGFFHSIPENRRIEFWTWVYYVSQPRCSLFSKFKNSKHTTGKKSVVLEIQRSSVYLLILLRFIPSRRRGEEIFLSLWLKPSSSKTCEEILGRNLNCSSETWRHYWSHTSKIRSPFFFFFLIETWKSFWKKKKWDHS